MLLILVVAGCSIATYLVDGNNRVLHALQVRSLLPACVLATSCVPRAAAVGVFATTNQPTNLGGRNAKKAPIKAGAYVQKNSLECVCTERKEQQVAQQKKKHATCRAHSLRCAFAFVFVCTRKCAHENKSKCLYYCTACVGVFYTMIDVYFLFSNVL